MIHISFWDVSRTYILHVSDISPGIYVRHISSFGFHLLFWRIISGIFGIRWCKWPCLSSDHGSEFLTSINWLIKFKILEKFWRYCLKISDRNPSGYCLNKMSKTKYKKTCPFFSRIRKAKHAKTKMIKKNIDRILDTFSLCFWFEISILGKSLFNHHLLSGFLWYI